MFEQDYLYRLIMALITAIRKSIQKALGEKDLDKAAETLENSISQATDLDGSVLLSLAPESIAQVLQVSNTDPRVVIYVAHSMQLQAHYLKQTGKIELSNLRNQQAHALADAYHFDLPEEQDLEEDRFNEEEFLKSIEELSENY